MEFVIKGKVVVMVLTMLHSVNYLTTLKIKKNREMLVMN